MLYAMSDMSKSFMLMADTIKISMQQTAMVQQKQQRQQHSMVFAYQPTHYSNLYSTQQVQERPTFLTMDNAHQPTIMSTLSINVTLHEQCQ